MPELDGLQATKVIREYEAASGKHTPIIALTVKAMKRDREKCLGVGMDDFGMDDYGAKPVQASELFAASAGVFSLDGETRSTDSPDQPENRALPAC